jgi:hypothetical protein
LLAVVDQVHVELLVLRINCRVPYLINARMGPSSTISSDNQHPIPTATSHRP